MSKESGKHKLEDFFRNSLQNLQAAPSDGLWDRIDAEIPPKPRRRRRWLVWFFMAGLLVALGTSWWLQMSTYQSQIEEMGTSLDRQKEQLSKLETQIVHFQDQLAEKSRAEAVLEENMEEQVVASAVNAKSPVFTKNKRVVQALPPVYFSLLRSTTLEGGNTILIREQIAKPRLTLFSSVSAQRIAEGITPRIPTKEIALLTKEDKELTSSKIQLNKVAVNSSPRVEFSTGIYQTYPTLDGKSQSLDWQFSKDIGVNLVFDLSKNFQFGVGLGYTELLVDGQLQEELVYLEEDPNNSDFGLFHSQYTYELSTRYGRLGISSVLANQKFGDGNDLEHGDLFQLDFELRDRIRYVNIPLTLRYGIGQGRYKLRFHAGFIQRIFYNAKTRLREVSTDFGRLHNDHTEVKKELGDIALTSLDFTGGIGVEYHFTPYTSVHFNSVYMQSLKEIYRHTKPYSFGLQLGLQTQLGKRR